jgi:uncharacterized HAD superfamily protein
MKIAVDFDDTIVHTVTEVLHIFNLRVRIPWADPVHYGDVIDWDMADILGISREELLDLFASVEYGKVPIVEGAIETIREWEDTRFYDVTVVTANPRTEDILDWMDKNNLRDVPLVSTPDKVGYLMDSDYDLLIDDNANTAVEMAAVGMQVILLSRPWNGHVRPELHATLRRCMSWRTLDRHVLPLVVRLLGDLTVAQPVDDDVIVNENGAKQSDLKARFDLLPARAVEEVARVLHKGAEKYGEENWRGLSVEEVHNHTLGHAVAFNRTEELEDLSHTACRALMALEIFLGGGVDG